MEKTEELTEKITNLEWGMFHTVSNAGGKASCQEDPDTFLAMRKSQMMSWGENLLESYLADLEQAKRENRNLLSEKYARMMRYTHPGEYELLKDKLPPLGSEMPGLIGRIMEIVLGWEKELLLKYPHLLYHGRPVYSAEDSAFVTSVETYMRGELATYSTKTLELYYKIVLEQKEAGINGSEVILDNIAKSRGFSSAADVEKHIAGAMSRGTARERRPKKDGEK